MTPATQLYVFRPGTLSPGRSENKSRMTTVRVPLPEYAELLKLCGGAHSVLRSIAREESRRIGECALGESWTNTVIAATRAAARKYDEEEQVWADANNAAVGHLVHAYKTRRYTEYVQLL